MEISKYGKGDPVSNEIAVKGLKFREEQNTSRIKFFEKSRERIRDTNHKLLTALIDGIKRQDVDLESILSNISKSQTHPQLPPFQSHAKFPEYNEFIYSKEACTQVVRTKPYDYQSGTVAAEGSYGANPERADVDRTATICMDSHIGGSMPNATINVAGYMYIGVYFRPTAQNGTFSVFTSPHAAGGWEDDPDWSDETHTEGDISILVATYNASNNQLVGSIEYNKTTIWSDTSSYFSANGAFDARPFLSTPDIPVYSSYWYAIWVEMINWAYAEDGGTSVSGVQVDIPYIQLNYCPGG